MATCKRPYEPKPCELCGQTIPRKMRSDGVPEDAWRYRKRKFCDMRCMAVSLSRRGMSEAGLARLHEARMKRMAKGVKAPLSPHVGVGKMLAVDERAGLRDPVALHCRDLLGDREKAAEIAARYGCVLPGER